jgi:hypothetical protein
MLVEDHDRGAIVPCLVCKTAIRAGGAPAAKDAAASSPT